MTYILVCCRSIYIFNSCLRALKTWHRTFSSMARVNLTVTLFILCPRRMPQMFARINEKTGAGSRSRNIYLGQWDWAKQSQGVLKIENRERTAPRGQFPRFSGADRTALQRSPNDDIAGAIQSPCRYHNRKRRVQKALPKLRRDSEVSFRETFGIDRDERGRRLRGTGSRRRWKRGGRRDARATATARTRRSRRRLDALCAIRTVSNIAETALWSHAQPLESKWNHVTNASYILPCSFKDVWVVTSKYNMILATTWRTIVLKTIIIHQQFCYCKRINNFVTQTQQGKKSYKTNCPRELKIDIAKPLTIYFVALKTKAGIKNQMSTNYYYCYFYYTNFV